MLHKRTRILHSDAANVVDIAVNPPSPIYAIDDFISLETSSRRRKLHACVDLNERDKDLLTFIFLENNHRHLIEFMPLSCSTTQAVWLLRRLHGVSLNGNDRDVPLGSNDAETARVIRYVISQTPANEEVDVVTDVIAHSVDSNLCENFRDMLFLENESLLDDLLGDLVAKYSLYREYDHYDD